MAKPQIDVLPGAYLSAAVLLLVLPLRWFLAWLVAAAIHEIFHILAILLCGGKVRCVRIGPFGADIEIGPLTPGKELICALSGPAGGLLLLPMFRWIPCIALFALLQSACNLLPIYPMDGGRALRCAITLAVGEKWAEMISGVCGQFVLFCLYIIGFVAFFRWNLGIMALLPQILLSIKFLPRKIPCKS